MTVAVNCWVWPGLTPADIGLIATATVGEGAAAATLIDPAVPESAIAAPAADAPRALLILTGVVVAVPVKVIVTTATMPLANVVWLTPEATHVYPAVTAAHEMVLPAAFADVPAATLMWDTLAAGYANVHCRPEGALPEVDDNERFSPTVLPAAAVSDESDKED